MQHVCRMCSMRVVCAACLRDACVVMSHFFIAGDFLSYVTPQHTVAQAISIMESLHLRHLPIMAAEDRKSVTALTNLHSSF